MPSLVQLFHHEVKPTEDPAAGTQGKYYELRSTKPAILRAGKELDSAKTGLLAPWSIVQVIEGITLPDASVRVRIEVGWLTMSKEASVEKVHYLRPMNNSSWMEVATSTPLILRASKELASTVSWREIKPHLLVLQTEPLSPLGWLETGGEPCHPTSHTSPPHAALLAADGW